MYVYKILRRSERNSPSQIGCRKPYTCVHTLKDYHLKYAISFQRLKFKKDGGLPLVFIFSINFTGNLFDQIEFLAFFHLNHEEIMGKYY